MDLDEGMGHKKRKPVRWPVVAGVSGAAVTGMVVAIVFSASNGGGQVVSDPASAPPSAAASAVPAPAGDGHAHDQETSKAAPAEAWSTLTYFMDGWASKDTATRKRIFAETATAGLAEGLMDTNPYRATTITQPVEQVEVVGAGPYSAEFRLTFLDVAAPVRVILVADPEAEQGWLASSIEKTGA